MTTRNFFSVMVIRSIAAVVLLCCLSCGQTAGPGETELKALFTLPLFTLTDQDGERFGSEQMRDHVSVVSFIFTRCTSTCPLQTATMAALQDRLQGEVFWDDVRLVSISVDPEYDTTEVLGRYATDTHADEAHWKFLTGEREAIWRLSNLGFKLAVGEDPGAVGGPLFHSKELILIDRAGRVRGLYDGTSRASVNALKDAMARLAGETLAYRPPDGVFPEGTGWFARPEETFDPVWLEGRRQAQLQTLEMFDVFHDFSFTDRRQESGITFRHKVTDDGAITMKPVHYDHGNGIPIADVDGDGLHDVYFINQVGGNQLWRNLGGGRFEDVTAAAGIALVDPISVTASFADIDNDGDPDLYVTTVREGPFPGRQRAGVDTGDRRPASAR